MKPFYLIAASGLTLTLAGCASNPPPARTALDCPATQGDLTRTGAAADGKTCTYVTSGGAEISLRLVSAPGGADAALAGIESTLLAGRQPAKAEDAAGSAKDAAAKTPTAEAESKTAATEEGPQKSAAEAVQEAQADTRGLEITVKADAGGDRVERRANRGVVTDSDGTTRVDLPGIHIVANEHDDSANVKVGPITVNAGDGAATIRMRRDVRLRGEALSPEKRGIRATFIYTGDDLPEGYRFVGYEAGGPKAGPITVAVVRSKDDGDTGGDIYPDVKKLVRRNGGV